MSCIHREPDRYETIVYDGMFGDEYEEIQLIEGESFFKHISTGTFMCMQCGYVGFYTGLWKNFYEQDEPCSGSELISIKDINFVRHCINQYKLKYVSIK